MKRPAVQIYPYQQRWFLDRSRFKLGKFARQTGKTFTTTLEIVDDLTEAEIRRIRSPWVILSRGERQAREAMEEGVLRHLDAYGVAMKSIARDDYEFIDEDSKLRRTALQIVLPNGNKCTALPANPDTARGFSANTFLDEFAFHRDSRKIWSALFPVISNGYKIRVTSTPNGKNNKFYDLATKNDPKFPWKRHIVDIHEAVKQGLPRDIEELRAALDDEDAWAQEFELSWLDEASAWLDYDLINSVEHDHAGIPENYLGGPCFTGEDIGIRSDLFVLWVLELVGDVLWTREIVTRKRASFAEQDFLRDEMFAKYNVVRHCIDQTGMGEKPVQDAQRKHGALRVEGVLFTSPNKLTMATIGKQRFQDKQVRIPMGQDELRRDLHKLKKEPSPTGGTPRFVADSDEAGHADRTWALFLACNAAGRKIQPAAGHTIGADSSGMPSSRFSGKSQGGMFGKRKAA